MDSLSVHEACDKAVTLVALQGRSGCKLCDVWVWLGIADDDMKAAVRKMILKRLVKSVREDGEEYVVAEECDRLRSLGLGRRSIVTDAMDMEILEEIGRRGREGCELSTIQAELKNRVRSSDDGGGGKKRRNLTSQHSEPLAVDRLVQLGLVTKTLRTRTVRNGKKTSRLTANVLRLSRFGPLSSATDERGDDQPPPWKRALMSALESRMKEGEPELAFLSLPPAARALERRWPFAELWKNLKDAGTLARIASLIDGPTPAVSTMKASAACDLCRKTSAAFAASPLEFFMSDLVRPDSKRGEGREMWCVGIKTPSSLAAEQRQSVSGAGSSSFSPQWYGPSGFLRGIYDKIRCAGAVGGRTNTLTRDLGHGTSKLIEKGVGTLVRTEMIQLRRVTEGRSHSFLALTPEACEIYTMWEQASTTMAAKKDVVDIAEALVKPERTVTSLDLKEPPKAAAAAAATTTTVTTTEANSDKKKTEDEDKTRTSFVPGKPIQHAHTAERKQRAAFIVATISKHRIVDKGALLLALYRAGDQSNSKRRVDAKTWKRLIQQLVETGELGEARVEVPASSCGDTEAGDVVVVLHAADVTMPGPESVEFVARRVAMMREEERRAAENEAERRHRNSKRSAGSGGERSSSAVAAKRPRLAKKWDQERRRRSRERFSKVSEAARIELGEYLAKIAEKQQAAKRARSAEDAAVSMPRRRKRTATTRRADGGNSRRPTSSSIGVLRPHKKAPPLIVGGMQVAPLARTMARAVVEARRLRVPCALSQILDSSVPRPSRDAACSRLLRRGWVKHAGGEDDETMLELPYQAILDAGTNELRRAVGDVAFFGAARKREDSYDLLDSSLGGGTVASLLSGHAVGAVSFKRVDRRVFARRLRPLPPQVRDESCGQLWRTALGNSLYDVPWCSPETGKCLDERLRAALRRAVFVASLLKGGHFFTCRAIVEAQHKSTVPLLDDLEMACLLFDLCDAGVLRVDRPPPLRKISAKPTIFDDNRTPSSFPPTSQQDKQQLHSLAMSALNDPAMGPSSPRFYVTAQAIARFLALEAADAQGPID